MLAPAAGPGGRGRPGEGRVAFAHVSGARQRVREARLELVEAVVEPRGVDALLENMFTVKHKHYIQGSQRCKHYRLAEKGCVT